MKPQFLPTTFEGRLWRLAEELIEVHHEVCKCGRFGPRADLTGAAEHRNNAQMVLNELADLEHAIAAVRADLEKEACRA